MNLHTVLFVLAAVCYIQAQDEGCENVKMDMVFVVDSSGSIGSSDYKLAKEFMKDLLAEADIDNSNVRVGVVIFSSADTIQFHLDSYKTKAEIYQAISAIPYIAGSTNTADGLKTMRTTMFSPAHGDRPNIPNIAVVITDGQSNINNNRTIPEAEAAKAQGIQIYAIGVGAGITEELNRIASTPVDDFRFKVENYSLLKSLRQKLFSVICSYVTEAPTPAPTTPKPVVIRRVNTRFDLVFVLDATSSVSKSNFDLMKKFIKDFIYEDDIYNENVRIGVVTSSNSHIQFHLDKHRTKDDIINDIEAIAYPPNDNTNTADAIRTMRTDMFTESKGDRLDVDNIAIVLTTGVSNSQIIQSESDAARTQGIHIFVVGIGLRDTTQMDVIANKPVVENRFPVKDFTQLEDLKEDIFPAVLKTVKEKRSERKDCPPEPAAVVLDVWTKPSGEGYFVCSLSEFLPEGVDIFFTLHVEGEVQTVNKKISSSDKEVLISFRVVQQALYKKRIYCSAVVQNVTSGSKNCHEESSNVITPSIMCPQQTTLTLVEGQAPENLAFKLTAPPELYCTGRPGSTCDVEVVIEIIPSSDELKCSKSEIISQVVFKTKACRLKFTPNNWKGGITIPVKATEDRIIDGNRFLTIQTYIKLSGDQIIQEKCADIQATVVDKDRTSICYSVNDPHIATFDKMYYDNHLSGDFILYKHKTLPYEVQVNFQPCLSSPSATCNCKAAIQSGDDVIVFTSCDTRQGKQRSDAAALDVQIFRNGELTPGTQIKQLGGGQQFDVLLPTGTVVSVMPSQLNFMNIFIKASPSDFKQTEGLCGNFNGRTDDDMNSMGENTFNLNWRASATIYSGVPVVPSQQDPEPATYSSCTQGFTPISKPGLDVSRCSSDNNDITGALIRQSMSTESSSSAPVPSPTPGSSRKRRQVVNTAVWNTHIVNYTLAEAERNCSDYLKNSSTVKACTNQLSSDRVQQSVTNCAYDLVKTGFFYWTLSHLSSLAMECITRVEQNQSSWTGEGETPGEPVLPQAIVTQLCVRDCGDNGQCLNSYCRCKNGYFGESCQFGPNTVPLIFGAEKTCNIQESSCETVRIDGDFFTSSDNLACHINFAAVNTRARKTESSAVVRAEYISMYQVGCTLPTRRSAYITVTNDGVHQSENVYLHVVHNSSCQTCVINDNKTDVDCHMITNVCVIEGQCYVQQQEDSVDSCNICNLDSSNTVWTRKTDSACKEGSSNKAIIAISVGCAVFGLLLILVVIIVILKKKIAGKSAVSFSSTVK